MTVEELIKELQKLPQDLDVYNFDGEMVEYYEPSPHVEEVVVYGKHNSLKPKIYSNNKTTKEIVVT